MIAFGLTERRPDGPRRSAGPLVARPETSRPMAHRSAPARAPTPLGITADDVKAWSERLQRSAALLERLERQRGWNRRTLIDLEIGFDGERVTVPIWRQSSDDGAQHRPAVLQGVLRLRVDHAQRPKVIAVPGTRLGLTPPPAWTRERRVVLVEGPSDMLAARSAGVPAFAVPGATSWRPEWARELDGREVAIVMDCDRASRHAAARIAADLERRGITAGIIDLAPARQDGYDLSDWLRDGPHPAHRTNASVNAPTPATSYPARSQTREQPIATPGGDIGCRPF
jgi:hypothetical protein